MTENSAVLLLILIVAPLVCITFGWGFIRVSKRLTYNSFLWLKFAYYVLGIFLVLLPASAFIGFLTVLMVSKTGIDKLPFDEKIIITSATILGFGIYLFIGQKISSNKPNVY